jgi:hypothetical protein
MVFPACFVNCCMCWLCDCAYVSARSGLAYNSRWRKGKIAVGVAVGVVCFI